MSDTLANDLRAFLSDLAEPGALTYDGNMCLDCGWVRKDMGHEQDCRTIEAQALLARMDAEAAPP